MARPSKVKSPKYAKFAVFEDAPHSSRSHDDDSMDVTSDAESEANDVDLEEAEEGGQGGSRYRLEDISEDISTSNIIGEQTDTDAGNTAEDEEDGREVQGRESILTRRTSISSLPESSVFDTDYESRMPPMHQPYTPPSARPTFRRPESVRRMQLMASPTPFERSSPRRSALKARSRAATPRSAKQSPRPRSQRYQEEQDAEEDRKEYPLVLLHITLLPVEFRWSPESMLETLPSDAIENLHLLRSKVSETILHRGILIPHPREEYELLEERLLEALELRRERVTKCGHFRARDSTSSTSSGEGSVRSADSGVGSSLDGEEIERCTTCHSPVKGTSTAFDKGGRKWSIKVFAANGLMRASAWTAAWSEMERVDVEILPWISEDLRQQLDARSEREEEEERLRSKNDQAHVEDIVEEQVRIAHESRKRAEEEEREQQAQLPFENRSYPPEWQPATEEDSPARSMDLPQVYRKADIPLSILLRNYLFLLAQDKRNVAIFAFAVLALWVSLRAAVVQTTNILDMSPPTCHHSSQGSPLVATNAASSLINDKTSEEPSGTALLDRVLDMSHVKDVEVQEEPKGRHIKGPVQESVAPSLMPFDPLTMESLFDIGSTAELEENMSDLNICGNRDLASKIFALTMKDLS